MVGGTGLYIRTLLHGPSGSPASTAESMERVEAMVKEDGQDWGKRCVCEREGEREREGGRGYMGCRSLQRLRGLDPEYAESLDRNDWYRLKRALDICTQTGR